MRNLFLLLSFLFVGFQGKAQVIYGANNYTQYHPGSLPIIFSVPHGGLVAPAFIPNRTCNSPTTVWDNYTIELSRQLDTALFNLTGCRPHLIICNLRRTKVDCNRNIADGACGNSVAETTWTEFQNFIQSAQATAQGQFSGIAFYIDLHAHGHTIQQLELGYGISATALTNSDNTLNTPAYINISSIGNLVSTNVNGSTHAELLRGMNAFGTLLGNSGFPAVPSQQTPDPAGNPYYSGGYNTRNHTCILPGNTVNGLQIESPASVWGSYLSRKSFADSTAAVLVRYLQIHHNLNLLSNCGLAPLPTELVDFSGISTGEKNILSWTSRGETNIDYFELLRSADGANFESIARIACAGSDPEIVNHSFEDVHPTGAISYYQLLYRDVNGQATRSKTIEISNASIKIAVFPNPATDYLKINSLFDALDVEIYNCLGQNVHSERWSGTAIRVDFLVQGYYIVHLKRDDHLLHVWRFIKN
jgi:hypothetical protein